VISGVISDDRGRRLGVGRAPDALPCVRRAQRRHVAQTGLVAPVVAASS
jgi:hypothetical protein